MYCNAEFIKCNVRLHWKEYAHGLPALLLTDAETGEPVAKVSVNIPDALSPNEMAIKDYSENEGIFNWLLSTGLVEDTGKRIPSGNVSLPVVRVCR